MPADITDTPSSHQVRASGQRWRRGFTVIGHRGAAGLVAENTLPSFRHAAALGVKAVELDVYAVDGELLVIHDATLNRTTNGRGLVMSHSLQTLRGLDANPTRSTKKTGKKSQSAQIPLLSEVLACLPSRVAVNIELKGPATAAPVARALAAWQPARPILVSSFEHAQLVEFRSYNTATPVAPLFSQPHADMLEIAVDLGACAINLSSRLATPARLQRIRQAGFGALVYTVNTLRSAQRLARDGATGVFTDRPDRISDAAVDQS